MYSKEQFIKKYQKVPVIEYDNTVTSNPLVSVCIQTYNQEKYIGECLDGILMQQTNFDFEILIGEDQSSDGTRAICIEYAKKYPNKIKLFLHSRENNIKVYGIPTSHFNFKYNYYSSKGKYLAICEGDDYWTDPFKLQKQVDFLEKNQDYGLIYSDVNLVDYEGKDSQNELLKGYKNRYKRIRKLYKSGNIFWTILEKNLINTLTVCVERKLIVDYLNKFPYEEFTYDHRIWLHIASYKKIKFVDEKWGTYRVSNQGISNSNGFFDKRLPLAKQSALINYLESINYNQKQINTNILCKIIYIILKSKQISLKEKKPTVNLLKSRPIYIIKLIIFKFKKLF